VLTDMVGKLHLASAQALSTADSAMVHAAAVELLREDSARRAVSVELK